MKSVFIIQGSEHERNLFRRFGMEIASSIESADIVLFTGGEDVSPELYGDKQHSRTWSNRNRDDQEIDLYREALAHKKAMVGICRGGQFLNVMNGGRMYQDVEGHTRSHILYDLTSEEGKEKVLVTSTHHQMMMPPKNAIILANARQNGRREWYDGQHFREDVSGEDTEVVYFQETNSLCFQPHPEYSREVGDVFHPMAKMFFKFIHQWSLK